MVETEKAVIGCLLLDYDRCADAAADILPEWFEFDDLKEIMRSIRSLPERGIKPDSVTILAGLSDDAKVAALDCANVVPSVSRFPAYVGQLRQSWRKRTLDSKLQGIALSGVEDADETAEALRSIVEEQDKLAAQDKKEVGVGFMDAAADFMCALPEKAERFLSGFPQFDRIMGGLLPGSVMALAARPGQGKTDFALSLMMRYGSKGYRVIYYSMEMTYRQLMTRITAQLTGINNTRIRDKALSSGEYADIARAFGSIKGCENIRFVEEKVGVSDIRQHIRTFRPDVVFVDHLGLLDMPRAKSRVDSVSETTRGLKALALETGIAMVELVQMNRGVEARKSKRPVLSDLKDSGTIEEDSDYVVFLQANKGDQQLAGNDSFKNFAIIEKNRHGGTGTVPFAWRPQYSRFYEIDGIHEMR